MGVACSKIPFEIGAILIKTETELVLKSRWVIPEKLLAAGFVFQFPALEKALQNIIHE